MDECKERWQNRIENENKERFSVFTTVSTIAAPKSASKSYSIIGKDENDIWYFGILRMRGLVIFRVFSGNYFQCFIDICSIDISF
mmetsp:Transcript_8845/g.22267  ORF Transcript_8845/g.22267 Transcript_8845/m.22267 type:complete len:85 (+) Transcript_8845:2291-2545(+)